MKIHTEPRSSGRDANPRKAHRLTARERRGLGMVEGCVNAKTVQREEQSWKR